MFPVVRSHSDYQCFIVDNLKQSCLSSYKPSKSDISFLEKFWITDLSSTFSFVQLSYSSSSRGSTPHDSANLLRSYLLMLHAQVFSIDKWVDSLRRTPMQYFTS